MFYNYINIVPDAMWLPDFLKQKYELKISCPFLQLLIILPWLINRQKYFPCSQVCRTITHTYTVILCLTCFRYGQLSGMVEPVAGIFGAFAVVVSEITVWSTSSHKVKLCIFAAYLRVQINFSVFF